MKKQLVVALGLVGLLVMLVVGPLYAESPETVYTELPDVANCEAGVLAEAEKEAVLAIVNRIRDLHNLDPVIYAEEYDREVAESSLIIAANNEITHYPPPDSACYSEEGARGAATSNLAWSYPTDGLVRPLLAPSATDVRNWLIDPDVPDLGHRRWLLNPFLRAIAYGRVDAPPVDGAADQYAHGAALKVSNGDIARPPANAPDFVAYPYGEYPLDLFQFGWYWSFSVVADATDYWANEEVDFSGASVRVRGIAGDLRVHSLSTQDSAVGLPNLLQWQVDSVEMGRSYQVIIDGVRIKEQRRRFTYAVRLVKPDWDDLAIPVHTIERFDEVFEIRAGQEFALYAPPPTEIPRQYTISRRQMIVQIAEHSPYVKIFWVQGTIGDEVMLPFDDQGVTLRIVETSDGVRNPLLALRRELQMPVYNMARTDTTFRATQGTRFAVYVSPTLAERGIQRVEWTQSRRSQFNVEFYSARVLLVEIVSGAPGDTATVQLGPDHSFIVQVRGNP
ncbi:MAG: CAP domain-containing protein [Caldilineaceae bacterium]|nr:CAP domain-containing protein [Caldilineaceae bacterium]